MEKIESGAVRGAAALRRFAAVRARAVRLFAALGCGFAGGWALMYGTFAPFGLGLVLGWQADTFAACAVGAVLGVMARFEGVRAIGLVCGLAGAAAVRVVRPQSFRLAWLAGGGVPVLVALGFLRMEGVQPVYIACADAVLAAAVGFALRKSPPRAGAWERGGTLVLAAAVLCGTGAVRVGGLAVGVAVCAAVELCLCCRGCAREALAVCAALGAALAAADASLAAAAVGLACGTVAAASIPPCVEDKFYCLAAYGAGGLAGAFCAATPGEALAFLEAVAVGGVGFVLLPKRYLLRDEAGESDPSICAERPAQAAAATRLGAVAASLGGIAETVNDVYTALPRKTEDYRWVLDNTHDTLCFNCGRREECWGSACTATRSGLEALRPILEQKGSVEVEDLPGQLARCIHPAALSGAVSRSFALYRSRRAARVHAEAMRTALTEQYGAVAEALDALAHQLGAPGSPDPYKSGRVEALFAGMGMQPLECSVTLDDLGRMRAAVTLPTPRLRCREADLAVLAEEVGRICRRRMDLPQKLSCRGMTTLLFAEKPLLRAVFGAAGAAARGTLSGDAVQQFCTAGAAQMILCDGMGTGRPAALDGNLAAELTARLLKAGFTAELSARLVNVALALKGEDEGGATLDLVSVDLYTGTARLYKAGAAPGFIVHGGQARAVGEASLPVGILGAVNGQSRMVHLAAGDLAVLVSDGLLVDGVGWVLQQLQLSAAAQDPPAKIAAALVDAARVRAQRTGRPDDITAAVLKLETV